MKAIDTENGQDADSTPQRPRKHGEDHPVSVLGRVRATIRNIVSAFKRRKAKEHTTPNLAYKDEGTTLSPLDDPSDDGQQWSLAGADPRNCILPTELLAAIFEAGVYLTWPNDVHRTPFVVTISHVCKHWRVAACSTSRLWAHIYLHPGRDDMTRMFLARAGQFPLDICFRSYGRQTLLPYESMHFVRSFSPRWATLYVAGNEADTIYVAWLYLRTMLHMPLLRRIELGTSKVRHISLEWTPQNTLTEQNVYVEEALLNGFTSLVLQGISGHVISMICEELNMRGDNPFPPYADISSWPLPLTHLRLVGSVLPWATRPHEEDHLVLPCLQTLEIDTQVEPRSISSFFEAIAAPALQTLCLGSGSRATWEGFETALPRIAANFRDLRTLHLTVSGEFEFSDPGNPVAFGARLDNLQQLTLEVHEDHQAVHFLHAWIRVLSDGGPRIWPQLDMLAVKAPCNSQANAFGVSETYHPMTLLASLLLANRVDRPLHVLLNSKMLPCTQ